MFRSANSKITGKRMASQKGGALAVAIFIIVVMSIIGVAMVRILSDLGRATVSDVYGARAYAAARSGAEVFLTDLFPLNSSTNLNACPAERVSGTPPPEQFTESFQALGLNGCEARVACDRLELSAPFSGTHFRIITQGICDTGDTTYSKQIILEAFDGGN